MTACQKRFELNENLFLIGFMGAGKTTLARRLARECCLAAVDIDRCIERSSHMRIKQLYAEVGDARFRELEAEQLDAFTQGDPVIIACGGGIVMGAHSREIIRERGFALHLRTTADESMSRISNPTTRPFFEDSDTVRKVCHERAPYYEELADATIDVEGKTVGQVAFQVQDLLVEEGVLCPVSK